MADPVRALLRALLVGMLLAVQASGATEVVDDRGVRLQLARPPQRIVALLPSLTEMVCALGQCERLVAVDRYSNFPDSVRALPTVGGGLDPQIEAIVALRPDLVLMASSSPAAARLQSLGLSVAALEPKNYADVQRVLQTLGLLLAVPHAPRLWRDIESGVDAAARSIPQSLRNQRVYFEVNGGPYAAGEASFIGETLTRLGLRNIVPATLGPFPKINPEFVVRADPDLVMVGDGSEAAMAQRPGWAAMRAVQARRICIFSPEQSDAMVRPGPRMADAARVLAQCVLQHAR